MATRPITEERRAELERQAQQRVALEERAFRFVEHLSLTPSIAESELLEIGQHITRDNYWDVTEERSISKLCGYPLCSNTLINVPKQLYQISLKDKVVYDITERKKFCSNSCYKASNHLKNQVSETPTWMRKHEKHVKLTIFPTRQRCEEGKGEIAFHSPSQALREELQLVERLDSMAIDNESGSISRESDGIGRESDGISQESDGICQESHRISAESDDNKERKTKTCESENRTTDDLSRFVVREQNMAAQVLIPESVLKESVKRDTLQESVKRDTLQESVKRDTLQESVKRDTLQESERRETSKSVEINSALERIKSICEWKTSKTVEMFRLDFTVETQRQPTEHHFCGVVPENASNIGEVRLALLDRYSKNIHRRKVVLEKLSHVWPKLVESVGVEASRFTDDVKSLVNTFQFTNKNINFKPSEWLIIGYVLLKILDEKKEYLSPGKKIVMNLSNISITENEILEIVNNMTTSSFDDVD